MLNIASNGFVDLICRCECVRYGHAAEVLRVPPRCSTLSCRIHWDRGQQRTCGPATRSPLA